MELDDSKKLTLKKKVAGILQRAEELKVPVSTGTTIVILLDWKQIVVIKHYCSSKNEIFFETKVV